MKAYRLKANKTNMVKLLQANGFNPTMRTARFNKGPGRRPRSYWLRWIQSDVLHTALLTTAAGRAFVRVTFGDKAMEDQFLQLTIAELKLYDLCEEVLNND